MEKPSAGRPSAADWYILRNGERQGPLPRARLAQLARDGWLTADDLVWTAGMPDWTRVHAVPGLVGGPLVRTLARAIDGVAPLPEATSPVAESRRRGAETGMEVNWGDIAPRHVLAAGGAFVAALGIAFAAIGGSPLSLAFTLGGLTLAALGMHVEVGRLLVQASGNVARSWREAAVRRHEARRLALENRRLELEVQRRAQERPLGGPPPLPPPAGTDMAGRT